MVHLKASRDALTFFVERTTRSVMNALLHSTWHDVGKLENFGNHQVCVDFNLGCGG